MIMQKWLLLNVTVFFCLHLSPPALAQDVSELKQVFAENNLTYSKDALVVVSPELQGKFLETVVVLKQNEVLLTAFLKAYMPLLQPCASKNDLIVSDAKIAALNARKDLTTQQQAALNNFSKIATLNMAVLQGRQIVKGINSARARTWVLPTAVCAVAVIVGLFLKWNKKERASAGTVATDQHAEGGAGLGGTQIAPVPDSNVDQPPAVREAGNSALKNQMMLLFNYKDGLEIVEDLACIVTLARLAGRSRCLRLKKQLLKQ